MAANPRNRRSRKTKRKNKACTGKRVYRNQMEALAAAVRTNMTWYRCPYCHKFHLTANKGMKASFKKRKYDDN